ncbi:uncharacterized protein LOC128220606 [Mya arenaria]|uniref:uncharacterized protein LOC128220606 n=1 Tax=Mya arenaria TaxID=6604 RepID=UPI0022E49965|nr:uncharacterized protein LOC128220606 [Mya arenaria]
MGSAASGTNDSEDNGNKVTEQEIETKSTKPDHSGEAISMSAPADASWQGGGGQREELLVAETEETADPENHATYQRLKTDKSADLHILNTRFNANERKSKSQKRNDEPVGAILNNTFAKLPARIDSANFHPHTVVMEREKSLVNPPADFKHDHKITLDDSNVLFQPGDHTTKNKHNVPEISLKEDDKTSPFLLKGDNEKCKPQARKSAGLSAVHSLVVPENLRGFQSPVPSNESKEDDSDFDPLEGLDIPRERVCSFGSESIYSVKEISDSLYQQYQAEVKNRIRSYGFFETFPSPEVVREAQTVYRNLDIPPPVDEDGNVLPHPPKFKKKEYMESERESFDDFKQRLEQIPDKVKDGHLIDIVNFICEGLENDKDRLIIIISWIVKEQLQDKERDTASIGERKECCILFRTMCRYARIKAKLVEGFIRDNRYVPGEDLNKTRGSWVAVLVNYTWLLVDPVLDATANANEHTKANSKMKRDHADTDPFEVVQKVFQDPERFIFTHFPDEDYWQLLARPVSRSELTELCLLRRLFFDLDMELLNYSKSVLVLKQPEITISLSFPVDERLQFKCRLLPHDNSISAARMKTYVFVETLLNETKVNIRIRFPKKCSYICDLFVAKDDCVWEGLMTTRIVYENSATIDPFPANPREEWGPGLDSHKLGLKPKTHLRGEILMQKGVVQIVFENSNKLQFDAVLFREDAKINPKSFKVSFLRDKNNEVVFIVEIELMVQGLFTLQLLARENHQADFQNVCNYMIRKERPSLIPTLSFESKDKGVEKVLKAPDTGVLQIKVDTSGIIQLSVEFKLHDKQELNFSEHSRHWLEEDIGYIELNFPRSGKYSLKVYGRAMNKGKLETLKDETIIADIPSNKWSPFPKEGTFWNSWYKIEAPLSHHLEEKEDLTFTANVQNAHDVAVLSASGWYHLDRVDKSWAWQGKVWTGPKSTKCQLLARFEVGNSKWSDLLWFKVISEDDYEKLEERQKRAVDVAKSAKTG